VSAPIEAVTFVFDETANVGGRSQGACSPCADTAPSPRPTIAPRPRAPALERPTGVFLQVCRDRERRARCHEPGGSFDRPARGHQLLSATSATHRAAVQVTSSAKSDRARDASAGRG
jgi:hypothetical protein